MYYWFHQSFYMAKAFPFIGGWLADRLLGDPEGWPHPVVGFGKVISLGEKTLNKGNDRAVKGGVMALILVAGTYLLCERILALAGYFHPIVASILSGIGVFYCLAGKTLVKEVKAVFEAVDRSTEEGRKQVGRIGGTHDYFGKPVEKPYIGTNERTFTTEDMLIAIKTNSNAELAMGLIVCLISIIIH